MINGTKINLRLYKNEREVIEINNIFNDLENRAATDHTEIYSNVCQVKWFGENGFWSRDNGTMLIETKDNVIVGTINFGRKSEFELSLGYRIFEDKNRNKGYMTEALKIFSSYLFDTIPLITRLSLYTAEDNVSSRKLAEKCGYSQEGILREAYFYREKICNWVIYSLLRRECAEIESKNKP